MVVEVVMVVMVVVEVVAENLSRQGLGLTTAFPGVSICSCRHLLRIGC